MLRRIKPRSKPRRGRLKGAALEELRWQCYQRDECKCVACKRPLRFKRGSSDSMHMAHIRPKAMFGDNLDNVNTKCFECHILVEHLGLTREGKRRRE